MRATGHPTFEQYVASGDWGSCAAWSVVDCTAIMSSTPQDASTFYARTERTRQRTIAELTEWWQRHRTSDGAGFAGLFLLTLIALDYSETRRTAPGSLPVEPHEEDTCRLLVSDPDVRTALLEVYATGSAGTVEENVWRRIRPESLRFHRHGTTSFLLRASLADTDLGLDQECAVKCLVYPFLRIPTIARATREYAARYRQRTAGRDHLVHVLASSDGWILMDFVEGRTLDEELETRATPAGDDDPNPDRIEEFGSALFSALSDLEESGLQHHDLTPSNIIVTRDSADRVTLRLVDLGANYLYLQNMPGQHGRDARFAAPEVRTGSHGPGFRSDLYSLGHLLLLVGSGSPEDGPDEDGHVPTSWYAHTPQLARFVEDLIDVNPAHRLLVFSGSSESSGTSESSDSSEPPEAPDGSEALGDGAGSSAERVGYRRLWAELHAEIQDVRLARTDRLAAHATVGADLKRSLLPLDGAPGRLWRLWRGMRPRSDDGGRGIYRRWLLVWSLLSVLTGAVLTALILLWTYRELGLDWDNQVIVLLRRATGAGDDEFPILDELRAPDYALPAGTPSVLFALMMFTTVLVGVRYYQSLFADLTPARIGRGGGRLFARAIVLEAFTRSWTVVPLLMVGPPLMVQPSWWPVFGTFGLCMVSVTNWLTSTYGRAVARAAQRADRRLSTVPESIPGVATYLGWLPGTFGYTLLIGGISAMLIVGWADDHAIYLAMMTAVNVFQLYWVKCGREGPGIRAGLVQACIAAERLRRLRESPTPVVGGGSEPVGSPEPVPADPADARK